MTSRSGLWRALRALLLLAAVLAALGHASKLWPLRFVTELDLAIADARLRAFLPRTLDPRVVIVDIDDRSLAAVGRWPWNRERMAALTDELFARQGAAVVGFDMLFAEPDASSGLPALERLAASSPAIAAALGPLRPALDYDARFAAALAGRNAVLGYFLAADRGAQRVGMLPAPLFDEAALGGRAITFIEADGYAANLPIFARAAPAAGFFNCVADPDGLVRSVPLVEKLDGRFYEPLSLAMYRMFTGNPAVEPGFAIDGPSAPGQAYSALTSVRLVQRANTDVINVEERAKARVPYRGAGGPRGGSFEYVSAVDVLQQNLTAGHLKGKLVLVGTTAPGLYDQRATPVAEVFPGVEVHASLLSGLLDGKLPSQPDWAVTFESIQLVAVAAMLVWWLERLRDKHLRALRVSQLVAGLGLVLVGINLWAYRAQDLVLPLAASLVLGAAIYFGATLWGYIVEGRIRRALETLFGSYVPPELVEEMARDPAGYAMRAEDRELTVMFCDMRNFTRASENLSPAEVRDLVQSFFTPMAQTITHHSGTLDKYIGDAIMAFWGAPDPDLAHAANATRAVIEMTLRMGALNETRRASGLPEIGLGIGLNTGTVRVGDMGSSLRRSYTVMGDAVNLASRIEGLTRAYGVDILVGEATRRAVGDATDASPGRAAIQWVEVDRVRVKGKDLPVTLFTPVGAIAGNSALTDAEMRLWPLALDAYRHQHWDEAQGHLQALITTLPQSPLAALYRQFADRCERYRANPPLADWDGAHTFDSK